MDTDPLPWWQGTIVAIDDIKKTMDLALDEGYSQPETRDCTIRHRALFFDRETRHELYLLDEQTAEMSVLGGNRLRVDRFVRENAFSDRLVPRLPRTGDKLVITNDRAEGGNIRLENGSGLLLENVTVYGAASFAFHENRGKGGNTFRHCRLARRPGTNRLMAARSDGFHSSLMERGALIEDCEFSSAGDDLLAIQGFFSLIMERPGARELLVASPFGRSMKVGSTIRISRMPDGESLGQARVVAMEELSDRALVESARCLPERLAAEQHVRIRDLKDVAVFRVLLDRDMPGGLFDLVGCADYSGAGAVIRRNHVHDGHIRGILIKSDDITVEDNVVERMGHGGIVFEAELYWLEGPFNSRARIRRNQVVDVGGGALDPQGASVTIAAIQVGNYFGRRLFPRMLTGGNQNTEIEITGNRIARSVAFPIWVRNTDRVSIRENRITAPFTGGRLPEVLNLSARLSPAVSGRAADLELLREPYFAIFLQNVTSEKVEDNYVAGAPPFLRADLGIVTLPATP